MFNINKITCIEDLRKVAKFKLPKMFYDYIDTGSFTETTYRSNAEDFQKLKFIQKVARDLSNRSIRSTLLGTEYAMPLAIAPTGLTGMQRADGEILAAKAAESFGVPFTLSTMSVCSIEDVAEHTSAPFWFQLYMMKDRDFMRRLIGRAKDAGCSALVLTLDLQVMGQRHKDIKNGLSTPPKPTLLNLLDFARRPEWCWHMSKTKRRSFGNIVGHVTGVADMSSLASWTADQFDPQLNWSDIEWIKEVWDGPLILKGIMCAEDAIEAYKHGADAIVISNHGGRQLDGAPSSISALEPIVEALAQHGSPVEVYMDGGITQGQDILRAKALGADGVMIGRAFLYGLAAFGQEGVEKSLKLLANELDVTMAFCGHTNLNNVTKDILLNPDILKI
ncbi:MAG: alpha-hydroxy-acid oxidizing protein [Alcaligenaceae bacterium]|jgi:L-lactate dehydrogenase (cytochrome)|nr:alpha-hydroxy-acid oxidizing protein [Alcaligenaceae bacterium]